MFKRLVSHHAEGKTNLVEFDHFGNTKGLFKKKRPKKK